MVIEIKEGTATALGRRCWRRGCSEQIIDRSRRCGRSMRRRGTGHRSWGRWRLGICVGLYRCGRAKIIIVVVVIIVVIHADPGHFHDNPVPPGRNWLAFLDDVHPDGHGRLFAVGSRHEGRLESKMVLARQWKGIPDLSKCRRGSGMPGLWGQKDVWLGLEVSVFRNEITVGVCACACKVCFVFVIYFICQLNM